MIDMPDFIDMGGALADIQIIRTKTV